MGVAGGEALAWPVGLCQNLTGDLVEKKGIGADMAAAAAGDHGPRTCRMVVAEEDLVRVKARLVQWICLWVVVDLTARG